MCNYRFKLSLAALHKDASNACVTAITMAGFDVDLHKAEVFPQVSNQNQLSCEFSVQTERVSGTDK